MIDFSHCKKAKNPRDETRKQVLPGSCNSFQGGEIAGDSQPSLAF
jgi:hypothetical protein